MPTYYVQKFTYDGPGESKCCGATPAHDHGAANQFTIDVKEYLANQGCRNIVAGPFLSGQPKPDNAKEFRWDDTTRHWIRV